MYHMGLGEHIKRRFSSISEYSKDRGKTFNLPNEIEKITSSMFDGYRSRVEEIFAPSVTEVSDRAFAGCKRLKIINLMRSISIGNDAFDGCNMLEKLIVGEKKCESTYNELSNYGLDNKKDIIYYYPGNYELNPLKKFNCLGMSLEDGNIILPDYIKVLDKSTIDGLKDKIESITGTELEEVKENTFLDCSKLKLVNFPKVKVIGDYAFEGCEDLKQVFITNIQSVGKEIFSGCENLKIVMASDWKVCGEIYHDMPENLRAKVTIKSQSGKWTNIFEEFEDGLKIVKLKDEIEVINTNMLEEYKTVIEELSAIGVKTIETNAFEGCHKLKRVLLFKVENIKKEAFKGCVSLKNANFGKVVEVGSNAFDGCKELRKVYLPNVDKLGENVFTGCENLENIIAKEEKCKDIYNDLPEILQEKVKNNELKICFYENNKALTKWNFVGQDEPNKIDLINTDVAEINSSIFDEYVNKLEKVSIKGLIEIEEKVYALIVKKCAKISMTVCLMNLKKELGRGRLKFLTEMSLGLTYICMAKTKVKFFSCRMI